MSKDLEELMDHECEEAQKRAREKVESRWRMRERQKKQNEAFVWSPENVAKILHLNDKLWVLMQEADRIGKAIYSDIQKMIGEGKDYYDKDADVEVRIIYEDVLAEGAEEDTLWDSVNTWYGHNGLDSMNDYDGAPLNWNINEFARPELNGHYICYMMHWYFHEGLYSLQDAVTMNPEGFRIYTQIFN